MTKTLRQKRSVLYNIIDKLYIYIYTSENAYFQKTEFSLENGPFVAMVLGKKLIFSRYHHRTSVANASKV